MKYRMLKTAAGSPDGIKVETYMQGHEYDFSGALEAVFVQMGIIEPVDLSAPPERAVIESVPEIKAKEIKPKKGK